MAKKRTKSQAGRLSKEKGKTGELEVVHLLKQHGFEAERGQQYHGRGDAPDVVHNMEGLFVEVKRTGKQTALWDAMEQAEDDMNEGDVPVVFHRKDGKKWLAILDADDFLNMMKELYVDQ